MGSRQNGSNEKGTPATVLVQTSETLAGLLQEVRTATPEELPVSRG
jgi:hypothetical protein